jgi:hypothetical protein
MCYEATLDLTTCLHRIKITCASRLLPLHPPLGLHLAGFEGHEASALTDPIPGVEIAHDSVFHQDVFDLFVGGDFEASSQTRHVESDQVWRIVFEWVVHWASINDADRKSLGSKPLFGILTEERGARLPKAGPSAMIR